MRKLKHCAYSVRIFTVQGVHLEVAALECQPATLFPAKPDIATASYLLRLIAGAIHEAVYTDRIAPYEEATQAQVEC